MQLTIESATDPQRTYNPRIENGKWICDGNKGPCEHFRYRHTDCRHILKAKLESENNKESRGYKSTSLEAYIELIQDPSILNDRYQEILKALKELGKPSTDREIAMHLNKSDPNYVRPRRNELADVDKFYRPLVEQMGKRRCKVSGITSITWYLTNEGSLLVKDLLKEN